MNAPLTGSLNNSDRFAIIFDVDGVLVDSYQAHWESWQALGARTGVEFTHAQFVASFGHTSRDIIKRHWDQGLSDAAIVALDGQKEAIYRQIVEQAFPVMDGAIELIGALAEAGFLLALGSSGPAENVALALDRLGVRQQISAVVTGADVRRGKPDPEIFLTAARNLDVAPHQCLVIEDAPAGVEAARKAQMAVAILLSRGHAVEDFAKSPDLIVHSLRELSPGLLRGLIQAHRPH